MRTRRWAEPDWLEEAAAWTRAQLGRVGIEPAGELTLERTRPWDNRPLLAGEADPAGTVERLLRERASRYALAELSIDTSDLSVEQVVEEICRALT